MASSKSLTVDQYLVELPPERRNVIKKVREVIKSNIHEGFEEGMDFGMIAYYVPLKKYPNTHNKKPLIYAALASQKDYVSLYLMTVYGKRESDFKKEFKLTGKKLEMGNSCVKFQKAEDLPMDLILKEIKSMSAEEFIKKYEESRNNNVFNLKNP